MDNEQEYISLTQAAKELAWNKATVYDWIKTLGIKKHRFLRNRNTYLHITDVQRLKEIKAKPWTAGPNTARTARNSTEKAEKPPILPPVKPAKPVVEKAEKRVYNRKKDTELPEGTLLAIDFARDHNVKRETFRDHMTKGLGPGLIGMSTDTIPERDRVIYSEREKPNRSNEKEKYLTREQQEKALEFWNRHKVQFVLCQNEKCPCHDEVTLR